MDVPKNPKFFSLPLASTLPEFRKCFALLNISLEDDQNIRIFDAVAEKNLYLLHYLEPTTTTAHVRGVIVKFKDGDYTLKCSAYPYTPEISVSLFENVNSLKSEMLFDGLEEVSIAEEGTILRVFWDGEWFVSTHKKINGLNSRWAGPPFGTLLDDLWPDALSLGKGFDRWLWMDCSCTFLLSHPSNKIVCDCPKGLKYVSPRGHQFGEDCPFFVPPKIQLRSVDEFISLAKSLNWKTATGLLYYHPVTKVCIKVTPDEYLRVREIRGNEPSLTLRYLNLDDIGRQELRKVFPEEENMFADIEKYMREAKKYCTSLYQIRFIQRKFQRFEPDYHYVITLAYNMGDQELLSSRIGRAFEKLQPHQKLKMIQAAKERVR